MTKLIRITEGHYVLTTRKQTPLQYAPKRFWEIEIVETAGDKCEHRTWSTLARRNRRAGL